MQLKNADLIMDTNAASAEIRQDTTVNVKVKLAV
jgi:hypothetical protein